MPRKADSAQTKFLNVDLDITAASGIDLLLTALHDDVIVMTDQTTFLVVELRECPSSIDEAIGWYFEIISKQPKKIRDLWNSFERRSLNVGIQAGLSPHSKEFSMSLKTIALLTELRANLVFTIYRPDSLTKNDTGRSVRVPSIRRIAM